MSWRDNKKYQPLEAQPPLRVETGFPPPPGYPCHNCEVQHAPTVSTPSDYGAMWAAPSSPPMSPTVVVAPAHHTRMVVAAPPGIPGIAGVPSFTSVAHGTVHNGQYFVVYPPTDDFCPATGAQHVVKRRQGGVSIIISVLTFPLGLLTLPFDRKRSCRKCNYVLREAWGGC